jgi:hypothetical protein
VGGNFSPPLLEALDRPEGGAQQIRHLLLGLFETLTESGEILTVHLFSVGSGFIGFF